MKRFEAFQDMEDKWRWRLIAASGKIVASSAETFETHAGAVQAAASVRREAGDATVSTEPGVGFKALLGRLIRREEERRVRVAKNHGAVRRRPAQVGPRRVRALRSVPSGSRH